MGEQVDAAEGDRERLNDEPGDDKHARGVGLGWPELLPESPTTVRTQVQTAMQSMALNCCSACRNGCWLTATGPVNGCSSLEMRSRTLIQQRGRDANDQRTGPSKPSS